MFSLFSFFFNDPATTEIYTLSLHDALPICNAERQRHGHKRQEGREGFAEIVPSDARDGSAHQNSHEYQRRRSEEHTSELQSLRHLVCRLLLEKKKKN